MSRFIPRVALLAFALFLAGCSSSAPTASDDGAASMTPADAVQMPARPLPDEPVLERGFADAIEAGTRTEDGMPGPNYWQQDAQYDLEATLHPEQKRLDGSARITYTNNSPDVLRRLHVELAQNLHKAGVVRNEMAEVTGGVTVERVAVNGTELQPGNSGPRYQQANTQLVLFPESSLSPGASATVEIDWRFTIPQAGAGARMGYSRDNLFFLAYWYPQISVYDDVVGWMMEPFMGQGEFYANFADYTVTVEAPAEWIVASTGALQNPDDVLTPATAQRMREAHASDLPMQVAGPDTDATQGTPEDTLRWTFQADQVRDVAFSATRNGYWEAARTPVGDRDGDGQTDYTAINTFYRPTAPLWSEVTRYQQHAITQLGEQMDYPYPWPHMTAVEGGGIIGGGMEFPMMTLMGDYNGRTDTSLYAVTAHELAHMWVPMIVSTNERRYSWIDEGMTTFNENDARADFFTGSTAIQTDRQRYLTAERAGLVEPIMRWSNFHPSGTSFGIASYPKPATLLVALRGLLGEDTFNDAFHQFIDTWAYKHPYPHDLFNTFETVSGRNLDWFWHSWFYEAWTLDHAVASVATQGDGSATVTIRDHGKAFMPARVTVTRADGSTAQRTVPVNTWLDGATEATLDVPAGSTIQRIEIDAARVFPDIDRSNNVWTADDAPATSSN
jgi:hypothetical protein